jgi:hypothetical protein
MGRTFLRQATQIRNSDTYNDTVAPTEANFETNPTTIEGDLNNLRSAIKTLLGETNWWDTATRNISQLETDLTDIEGKRVICGVEVLTDVTVPAAVKAKNTLTSTAIPNDGDTVTIGAKVYTFQTVLTDVDGNVAIGGSQAQAMENLRRAINLDGVAGTNYATSMTSNALGTTATDTATTVVVEAVEAGSHKNSAATTETSSVMSWADPTLGGAGATAIGAGNQVTLNDAGGETPTFPAAVGGGTALGAIVATLAGQPGTHDLVEVSSTNPTVPKNRCLCRDASLHEGITDAAGRQVYALIQAENGVVDGDNFDDATKQVQLSFVVISDADDLVPVDATDIGGQTIEYVYPRRVSIDTLPEDCAFPHFTFTDGGASVSVTLNNAIDNQGVTPATQATNIDWDLVGAGVELAWRDALNADLLRIIEGSAGGTTKIQVHSAVDLYDNDAVDVDFANGIKVDSGGSQIDIGTTAGEITGAGATKLGSGGGADLSLVAALELNLTDSYRAASTWSLADGISLADSTAEWTAFESAMEDILGSGNGEVSLLKAITEAAKNTRKNKVFAEVTAPIAADANASGPATDNNLDAELGNLSGGTFLQDYDVYLNGDLQEGGADAAANNDYYPGTSLALGQLKFEFPLTPNDKLCVVSYA